MIIGPSKAGKTAFVKKLIENKDFMINQPIFKTMWFYTEDQPLYSSLKDKVDFIKGIPDINQLKEIGNKAKLIVLDDLMHETKGNDTLIKLFTRGCHHWNISVIQIVQNAFFEGLRTSRINTDYLVLFKNPADKLHPCIIGSQLFPHDYQYFIESYNDATAKPHGYLFIDLTQYTPDEYRLKTKHNTKMQ